MFFFFLKYCADVENCGFKYCADVKNCDANRGFDYIYIYIDYINCVGET